MVHGYPAALAALFLACAAAVVAGEVVPLTDEHWRHAPATVLEEETGIPSTAIDELRRREREADPYPSIPVAPGPPIPRARTA